MISTLIELINSSANATAKTRLLNVPTCDTSV
jgi:hypothetical protein